MVKLASVENLNTGVDFLVRPDVYENFKTTFLFKGWIETEPIVKPEPVALRDIHQMNKVALLKEANKMGLQVSDKMTVGKLKEAILDYSNSHDDDNDLGN